MTEKELFPRVLVDHGEFAILRSLKNACKPEVVHLPVGDLLIADKMDALVLERKTVPDFISSMRSNRLWSQLLALMKHNEILGHKVVRRILVIHGGFWEYTNVSKVNEERFWASVFGALMQVEFIYHTPVIVCENNFAFDTFLRILVQREAKGRNEGLPKERWYTKSVRNLPEKNVKQYIIDSIPLVGQTRAKILLESFGSIAGVANSSVEEIAKVPGIGEKRAKQIYGILH